jgi:hypothetical protein
MSNLAILAQPTWFKGVMLTAYGDESADEKKERVFAIAGLFGKESEWASLESQWIERTGGKTFHANDCESNRGDYKDIEPATNLKLYADLAQLIAKSKLTGIGVALSMPAYNEFLAHSLDRNPYYVCFHSVVVGLAKKASVCIPPDRIEFIFDRNVEIHHNASTLYDLIMKLNPPELAGFMQDKISFATRDTVGIQIADLVARETMKILDNRIGPKPRHARLSAMALAASKRIQFQQYTKDECRKIAKTATRKGWLMTEYHQWLAESGLYDTLPNRIQYTHYRTALEANST